MLIRGDPPVIRIKNARTFPRIFLIFIVFCRGGGWAECSGNVLYATCGGWAECSGNVLSPSGAGVSVNFRTIV